MRFSSDTVIQSLTEGNACGVWPNCGTFADMDARGATDVRHPRSDPAPQPRKQRHRPNANPIILTFARVA